MSRTEPRFSALLRGAVVGVFIAGCGVSEPTARNTGGMPGAAGSDPSNGGRPSAGAGQGGLTAGIGGESANGGAGGSGVAGSGGSSAAGGAGPAGAGAAGAGAPAGSGGAAAGSSGSGGALSGTSGSGGNSEAGAGGGAGNTQTFEGKELFILFGQSNMSGLSPMPDEPWPINENITFMVQYDCPRLDQVKDEWLPAEPPLHGCQWATNGLGLGLADYFGVTLAATWTSSQIGLIPNAIPGVAIDVFMKEGGASLGGSQALPDGYTSAYALMVDRTKEAQKLGRVRAILFHQGESDWNRGIADQWLDKVAAIVANLRVDLELTEAVPFIAGEVPPEGNYAGANEYVNQIPGAIPNSVVVSAEGTDVSDVAHFDSESARIMGERYAAAFLELL